MGKMGFPALFYYNYLKAFKFTPLIVLHLQQFIRQFTIQIQIMRLVQRHSKELSVFYSWGGSATFSVAGAKTQTKEFIYCNRQLTFRIWITNKFLLPTFICELVWQMQIAASLLSLSLSLPATSCLCFYSEFFTHFAPCFDSYRQFPICSKFLFLCFDC